MLLNIGRACVLQYPYPPSGSPTDICANDGVDKDLLSLKVNSSASSFP